MSERRRLGGAIASNYVAFSAQVVFLLALTPYVIARQGAGVFGAWTIVLLVAGYLRLLDLGIGQATARFVAARFSVAERREVVATSIVVLALAGLVGTLTGLVVAALSPGIFGDHAGLPQALAVMAVSTGLQVPLNTFGNALFGLGRIVERNAFVTARMVVSALAIVVTVETGGGLAAFVSAQAAGELAVMLAQAAWCRFRIEELKVSWRDARRSHLREVGSFSIAVLGFTVATQLAFYSDGLVIGAALGTAAVAVYTVAARLVEGTSQLLSQFADVFMPVFAELDAAEQTERGRALFFAGTQVTLVIGFPLIGLLIALGEPLIRLWIPQDAFAASWPPLAMLAGALVFTAPLRFGVLWAIGSARHGRIAFYAIVDSVANILLSVLLVGPLGIVGVSLATLVTLAISNGWLIPRAVCAGLGVPLWSGYLRPVLVAACALAPLVLAARLVLSPAVDGSIGLTILAACGWLLVSGVVLAVVVLDRGQRAGLRERAVAAIGA